VERSLETTTVSFTGTVPNICTAPQYVAGELLRAEGFTEVRYVNVPGSEISEAIARGIADFGILYAPSFITAVDSGPRFKMLAGVHVGCFELFGGQLARTIGDLKGKRFAIPRLGGPPHLLISALAAYIGLDPAKDIDWVISLNPKPVELFVDGRVDAFIAFPPEPQDLRARGFGDVVVNSG
jgi:NitT/TauT family transport system substrate-binding protein